MAVLLTGCTVAGSATPERRERPEVLTVQATVPLPTATPYPGYEGGSAAAVADDGAVTVLLPGAPSLLVRDGAAPVTLPPLLPGTARVAGQADGSALVTGSDDAGPLAVRVDPAGAPSAPVRLPGGPALVVADGTDVLLVTPNGAGVDLVRADAATGQQTGSGRVDLPGQGAVGPVALSVAPDGSLWLLATRGDGIADGTATLVSLDAGLAETGRVPASTSAQPNSSSALDVDDAGTAWVVVGQRLPGTDTALLEVRPGDAQPRRVTALRAEVVDVAVDPDGGRVHLLGRVDGLAGSVSTLGTRAGRFLGSTDVCRDARSSLAASPDGATLVVLGDCGYGEGPQAAVLR
ncbi:hypothetical protein [Klenkia taihuensis]|uniref:Uncharacterized protein n=1 Tax=Klenkia taihuensis TaxID=1225127 RepID=A0A1I1V051_9ACTN|nr:hypothetical protein [Klenkia taihuensis]GHE14630.1 hypothetical protein GCM10011381_41990 [Klenkia taihuensis]SFD76406.1 hypothetical protein SAMN05661030_4156 [Klenkia taihuensis]